MNKIKITVEKWQEGMINNRDSAVIIHGLSCDPSFIPAISFESQNFEKIMFNLMQLFTQPGRIDKTVMN